MTGLWFVLSHLALLWTALVILSKMIYQLDLVDNKPWLTNCTRIYYNTPGVVKPKTGIIFSDIQRKQADEGLIECGKFFLNYFFYKFGLEVMTLSQVIGK
ncbi:hypothetical protein DPMN_169616 [Dreissena polymorpha]|uniref:Uncharacterized protein n=1 Tax=Dreissena polymorpha TaxID=45954 RepID=A0A9D4DY28_DREPO|nr:hypothetical protein DPMN_169616 [Dreissena polymorpha]